MRSFARITGFPKIQLVAKFMRNIGKQQILWPDHIKQRLQRVFTENPLFAILQCNAIVRSDH